jgi:tripartite-type tricarboxylate transporter receptor subunit TctC
LGRILAEAMRASLGQPVVIENVSGAGGAIGVARVARAPADGYTLSLGHVQTHVINAATQTLQYDVVKDFEPVSLLADTPQWIVARSTFPATSLADMIAWMKANPGKATAGAVGVGGPTDIAAIYFQKHTGTNFQLVPYRGGAPLVQDLVAGQIDLTFGQAANYLGHVRGGRLKAYAVLAKDRWWAAPDVPTMDEAGVPGFYSSFWHGLWVPKGTPKDVVARLHGAVVEALADPALGKRFGDIGQEIWPRAQQTPEALAALQKSEIEKWWPIIKAANIKAE